MTMYVGILTVVLLALLAGLLATVGWWLYEFRRSYKQMPLLGEELTRQLMQAREALNNLQRAAKESGPELAKAVAEARRITQDLQFLTQKGEEVASALDAKRVVAKTNPDGGKVVAENIVAAASASPDPLEELLAGLGGVEGGAPHLKTEGASSTHLVKTPSRVVSRTEEDMRRKLGA